jgi:thiamine biosynthesis lipoprotein
VIRPKADRDLPAPPTAFLLLMVALPVLLGCGSRAPALERFDYRQIIMGVEARITLYAADEAEAVRAARAGFERMIELEGVMSDYRRDSELMQVCRAAPNERIPVSDDLFAVLSRAQAFARISDGAFDVTVGPLSRLWREARSEGKLPPDDALIEARSRVGWRKLILHGGDRSIEFASDGMLLDLGGIGKGFAADEALETLESAGFRRTLIDLGGDIRVGDAPPDREHWRISIDLGTSEARGDAAGVLPLVHAAAATSGDTEQHVEIDGVRYSHILDPRTGLGLTTRTSVTVIAPDATTADALASALSVLGPERGMELLEKYPECSARFEIRTDQGLRRIASDSFPILEGPSIR